ncbi:hypothetical protein C8J57DRAFT_1727504 [Mycena rebaudengoi]|nr:hypothetical protein C8J57DRAFT_1727504 [Mycena rebaudengoi]
MSRSRKAEEMIHSLGTPHRRMMRDQLDVEEIAPLRYLGVFVHLGDLRPGPTSYPTLTTTIYDASRACTWCSDEVVKTSVEKDGDAARGPARAAKPANPDERAKYNAPSWTYQQLPCAGQGVLGLDVGPAVRMVSLRARIRAFTRGPESTSILATLMPLCVISIPSDTHTLSASSQAEGAASFSHPHPSPSRARSLLPATSTFTFFGISSPLSPCLTVLTSPHSFPSVARSSFSAALIHRHFLFTPPRRWPHLVRSSAAGAPPFLPPAQILRKCTVFAAL